MNHVTKTKLDHLQRYCVKHFHKFKKRYSQNIIGVHVAKKTSRGEKVNRYAIVFHVDHKTSDLPEKEKIPKYLRIKFPDGKDRKVLTDVVQTRAFMFQNVRIGSLCNNKQSQTIGSLGFFLSRNREVYAVSNMHVFGDIHMLAGRFHYFNSIPNQTVADIELTDGTTKITAFLEEARFGNELDAAIARIRNPSRIENLIPNIGRPQGHKSLNSNIHVGKPVVLYAGIPRRQIQSSIASLNAIVLPTVNGQQFSIRGLTQLDGVVTAPGDSGSIVFNDVNQRLIAGIVMGADDFASYFIPITKILDFFGGEVYTL